MSTENIRDDFLQLFHHLTNNWNTTTVSTAVLAILTLALTYYTRVLAKEAEINRLQSVEPNIVVTIEPSDLAHFYAILTIENVGSGIAYNVIIKEVGNHKFKHQDKEFILNDLLFMRLKLLKAGHKIEHVLGNFQDLPEKFFEFEVQSKDSNARLIKNYNAVDINCYFDRVSFNHKKIHDGVKVLEQLEKSISNLASGYKRLKVDVYSDANRDRELKIQERIWSEQERTSNKTEE